MNDATLAVLGLGAVALLVAANGLFVATEFSYVAVRQTRVDELAARGVARARVLKGALGDLDNYIAATQLGITLASLGLGWIGEPAVARLVEPAAESILGGAASTAVAHGIGFALAFVLITMAHIVFGELAPKSVALARPETTALLVAAPIAVFNRVFRPFIWSMNMLGRAVVRPFGLGLAGEHGSHFSAEELEIVLEASARAGLLSKSEAAIARRALEFGEIQAQQLMVPRTELVAIDRRSTLDEVIEVMRREHHARYPVYQDNLDHIIGILEAKDLAVLLAGNRTDWRSVLRPAVAVPEGVSAEVATATMRAQNTSALVVVDEHGGTSGMLTADEFLSRVLGLWLEDTSPGGAHIRPLSGGNLLISGLALVDDVEDELALTLDDRNVETIGGYVMDRLGRVPAVGDRIALDGYELRVLAMDRRRVDRLLAVRTPVGRAARGVTAPSR